MAPDDRPVVLVTGASSGIGAETVAQFARNGFRAVAAVRRPEALESSDGLAALTVRLDVTDHESIESAVAATIARFGRVDVLVNNAGYGLIGPLESLDAAQIERQFATNVLGLIATTRSVLPHMRRAGGGTIVNIASIGGRLAFPFASAYHATKWAVEGLSESLQYEMRPLGIRVKVIEPGGIRTDFGTRSMELAISPPYEVMTRKMLRMYRDRDPKLPGPQKVAETILRAATDRSERLRYLVHHQPYWLLHTLLPAALWRRVVGSVVGPVAEPH